MLGYITPTAISTCATACRSGAVVAELSGDGAMAPFERLRWLVVNACRNIAGCFISLKVERVRADGPTRLRARSWHGSPSRLLSDMVVERELSVLAGQSREILDIGCGSGLARRHFVEAGLQGTYLGIDIDDRFDRSAAFDNLESDFRQGDAHQVDPGEPDLVFSFSALEHIPDDAALIERLRSALKPAGVQFHVVPGGWALLAYLWHGYRHYHRRALKARFPADRTRFIAIGGPGCLMLHTLGIAVPEILFRGNLRRRFPGLYGRLMACALALDGLLPIMPTSYVVIETSDGTS